jgi:tetratricopeptide (TPR) repeat protein
LIVTVNKIHWDYDIWFHIKNGEFILNNLYIPHKDQFLYTTPILPSFFFPNYEWLFGIITYFIYSKWQYIGISVFRTAIILVTFGIAVISSVVFAKNESGVKEKTYNNMLLFLSISIVLLGFAASVSRFAIRPQIVSGLYFSIFLFLLFIPGKMTIYRYIFLFFITLLWTNSHIEVLVGFGVVGLSMIKEILDYKVTKSIHSIDKIKERLLLLLIILTGVVISPPGRFLFSQGVDYFTRKVPGFQLVEMMPLNLSESIYKPYGIILILTVISFIILFFTNKKRLTNLVYFVPFTIAPFVSMRFIYLSTLMIIPILILNIYTLLTSSLLNPEESELTFSPAISIRSYKFLHAFIIIIFPIVIVLSGILSLKSDYTTPPPLSTNSHEKLLYSPASTFPDAAIRFLNKNDIRGNIFCPYEWGNFIIFYDNPYFVKSNRNELYTRKPFIDGMIQTYHKALLEDYMKILSDTKEREKLIQKYDIDIFLLSYPGPPENPTPFANLGMYLAGNPEWRLVYWNDNSIIYLRKDVYERYSLNNYSRINPVLFDTDPSIFHTMSNPDEVINQLKLSLKEEYGERVVKTYLWLGITTYLWGDKNEAFFIIEKGLTIKPDSSRLLYNLGIMYLMQKDKEKGKEYIQKSLIADPNFTAAAELLKNLNK